MRARIYRPAKTAMQSGRGNAKGWIVEYEPQAAMKQDPVTGWTTSSDTGQQVKLGFATRDEAIAFCKRKGIDYQVREPRERAVRPKSYAENFRTDRVIG